MSSDEAAKTKDAAIANAERLLGAGKLDEARAILERLHAEDVKSSKIQGLLALTLFKLNDFENAATHYEQLVHDNPIDPTLRINLGLVYVKGKKFERAIEELEIALDLDPEHKKAQGYLGLALSQTGQYARAQACFIRAGNLNMAERMEQAMKNGAGEPPSEESAPKVEVAAGDPHANAAPEMPSTEAAKADRQQVADAAPEAEEADGEFLPVESVEEGASVNVLELDAASTAGARGMSRHCRFESLEALEAQGTLALKESAASFVLGDTIQMNVRQELFSRVNGLLIATGGLEFTPLQKRFQGAAVERMFGTGDDLMMRVAGEGALVVDPAGRTFVSLRLRGETVFFQEKWLYAFESSLSFENGRIQLAGDRKLSLVCLSGSGRVLLALPGPVLSRAIKSSTCQVPLTRIVGWHDELVPRALSLSNASQPLSDAQTLVELSGQGVVLLTREQQNR